MRHWIRDTVVTEPAAAGTYDAAFFASMWVIYHFLRTAGWTWLWEDDHYYYGGTGDLSDSSHCPDSNMETVGASNWTPDANIAVAKDSTYRHMLSQSLKITNSQNGASGSVDSDTFIGMPAAVTMYCVLRYRNPTSNTYSAQLNGEAPVSLPPTAGSWEEIHIQFTSTSTDVLSINCPDVSGVPEDIWVDSINVFRSWYEYTYDDEDLSGSPDGQILNDNEFHSDSHSFVTGDIGKLLCVWDTTNEGNSGVWGITGVNGNDAVLDLRAGGTPVLVAQTGLRWRLLDTDNAPYYDGNSSILVGFGLESPHSSAWRFFAKPNWVAGPSSCELLWMSPVAADFDVQTGHFNKSFPVTYDVWDSQYKTESFGGHRIAGDSGYRAGSQERLFVVTDDDGTYLQICVRPVATSHLAYGIFGVTGGDPNVPEDESFAVFCVVGSRDNVSDLQFATDNNDSFGYYGSMATSKEFMVDAKIKVMGYADSGDDKGWDTYGQANPFSGEEWTVVPVIVRDESNQYGEFAQKNIDTFGVRHCRVNYPEWTLLDTDLLHMRQGWCMPWPDGVTPL